MNRLFYCLLAGITFFACATASFGQLQWSSYNTSGTRVTERMLARLDEMDLMRVAHLEFDCVLSVASMELAGFYLDTGLWRELIAQIKVEHERVTDELQRELSAGAPQMNLFGAPEEINLDSPQQVREALARIGIVARPGNVRLPPLPPLWR